MVEGMEAIVATVSGYHGSQRLKLIQLITAINANYVGKLSKSCTHLVCWKFEGEKYELAKRIGTIVVNHQWLEDCMKEGKRIPEHPYTLISGQDAGFITTDLSVVMEQAQPLKKNTLLLNKRNMHDRPKDVIDLDSDEIGNDDFYDELLLDENLFPKPGRKTIVRQKSKRRVVKETFRGDWQAKAHNIMSNYEVEIHTDEMLQSKESVYLPSSSNKQRKRYSDISTGTYFGESSRRSRRLVKKNAIPGTTVLATNGTELQSRTLANRSLRLPASRQSNDSNELREDSEVRKQKMNHMNDIDLPENTVVQSDDIPDADERNLHEISSCQNLEGQHENKDLADNSAGLHKSVELSCVICWTEFSSTRGVLPCGHRFCFSCIQKWADRMASNRKETTCPLCNSSFASITRVDGVASLDQKIYSQTVPCASSSQEVFIVPEAGAIHSNTQIALPSVCCHCQSSNPTDLLKYCQICGTSCIHSYCLDPLLLPWTCTSCRDRRLFYYY